MQKLLQIGNALLTAFPAATQPDPIGPNQGRRRAIRSVVMGGKAVIKFTLNGQRYDLSRYVTEARLEGVAPEPIHTHAVNIGGVWYPVLQAFEAALGVSRDEFTSHTARRHLAAIGFELHGDIQQRHLSAVPGPRDETGSGDWHTEAHVQAALVTALTADGWQITSLADTATKARGIDVVAQRSERTVGVEVKGFPSRSYADPARSSERKPTSPSTQAAHWFAQAVLAAMRLRHKHPDWDSIIALPDFTRYRALYAETRGSLTAAGISVWWIRADGSLEHD